jgi:alkylation response protein AidB-like acyl-CoA dehydrogenase
MINCDSGYVTAFLDQSTARRMYADIHVGTAASAVPAGRAVTAPGGYVLSGHFPFASGCHQCAWIWLGCVVIADGEPQTDANGVPVTRQCFLKVSDCKILDTWHTTGLRGTGSSDVVVNDVFVPEEQTFSFQDPALVKRSGPLHNFPFLFLFKTPSVALGIAHRGYVLQSGRIVSADSAAALLSSDEIRRAYLGDED